MAPIQEQLGAFFKSDMPETEKKDTLISIGKHIHNLLETKLEYEVDSLKEALWGFCAAGHDATAESLRTSYKQWKKEKRIKEEAMAIKVEQAAAGSGVMDVAPDQPSSLERSAADVDTDEPMAKRAKEGGEGEPAAPVTKRTVNDDAEEEGKAGIAAEEHASKVAPEQARGFDSVMVGGQLAPSAAAVAATLTTALAGSVTRPPKMEPVPPPSAAAATTLQGKPALAASAAPTAMATTTTAANAAPAITSAPVVAIAEEPALSGASVLVPPLVSGSALARPPGASTSMPAPPRSTLGFAPEPLPASSTGYPTAAPSSISAAFPPLSAATSLPAASVGSTTLQSASFMPAAAPAAQGNVDAQGVPAAPGPATTTVQAETPSMPGAEGPSKGGTPGLSLQGVTPSGTAAGAGEAGEAGEAAVGAVEKSASGPPSANGGAEPNTSVASEDSAVKSELRVGASAPSPAPAAP